MEFFKWLYPGMRVKRWILLLVAGLSVVFIVALYTIKAISEHSIILALFVSAVVIFSLFIIFTAIKNILKTFVNVLMPTQETDLVNAVYQKKLERDLERGPRIVVVGGGTGLNTLLQGIKEYTNNITAIVTVTDTGGSSGRLRDEFDMLPPGDIRNCLVALADRSPLLEKLFQYRFEGGGGLKGHNFGNLFILAMTKVTGCFDLAVKESSRVLAIRGQVIPSTLEKVTLEATFEDGTKAEGETNIVAVGKKIKKICLKPASCEPTHEAIEAIENADLIILGPGSLYTSVLPNLLIKDINNSIQKSEAYKVYVNNVMTQPGETDDMTAYDHVEKIIQHTGKGILDGCLVNVGDISQEVKQRYEKEYQLPVVLDVGKIEAEGIAVFQENIIHVENAIRHSPPLLAKSLFDIYLKHGAKVKDAK